MTHDARDAEDALLLEQGDHVTLLAAYHAVVVQRCRIAAGDAGYDVAQNVFERLLKELKAGKRYPVPYRVVVHQVIDWTIKGHFQGKPMTVALPEDWDVPDTDDVYAELEQGHDLGALFAGLPDGARKVAELVYFEGLDPDAIAERLGMKRNAVDQSLHRAHAKLKELVGGG